VNLLKSLVNPDGKDIDGVGGANTTQDAEAVINYTLNPGYASGAYQGTRDPNWKLGDIYNSAPSVVTAPNFYLDPTHFPGYEAFKEANQRQTLVYVGGNDGMVHSIQASNGHELCAFIPKSVLHILNEFKLGHRYTVDLTMKAADIYSPGGAGTPWAGAGWHTVLASGLRKGGDHYFALDITDDNNTDCDLNPMWEMTDDNMGYTWSVPTFGRININGTQKYVLFVGGGYENVADKGNRVYILDVEDGEILKEFQVGSATNNVPSELLVIWDDNATGSNYGNAKVSYFGDTSGDLWKISGLNASSGWNPTLTKIYDANPSPVFHAPTVSVVESDCVWFNEDDNITYTISKGTNLVLFGTGSETDPDDTNSTDYFYEIADPPLDANGTTLRVVWSHSLPTSEKALSDPVAYLDKVYFTTYQPTGFCQSGSSYLYALNITQCGQLGGSTGLEESDKDDPGNPFLDPDPQRIALGPGIATSPTLGPPTVFVRTQGSDIDSILEFTIPAPNNLLFWKEMGVQ
jgi:Tfp pilus tip-associated adhesin PilY1